MRAAIIDGPGRGPRLGTIVLPPVTAGHSLIRLIAAPLNPLDLAIASGEFHSVRHEDPYVPGSECVGEIMESEHFAVGDLVYAECHASPATPGSFAAAVVVADEAIVPLPGGVDPVLAAAVGNSGTAAYLPLVEVAAMRPGETVLVLGATGAVGQLAVQVASRRGAGRVVGVARNQEALLSVLGRGADAVVDLRPGEAVDDLAHRILEAAGPVDVVLDGIYGPPFEAALRACRTGARIVNVGNLAGPTAQVPAGLLRGRQITVSGFAGLHTPVRDKHSALTWLWTALAHGELGVEVSPFSLGDLPAAWRAQASSPHAKCVVLPDDRPAAVPFTGVSTIRSSREQSEPTHPSGSGRPINHSREEAL